MLPQLTDRLDGRVSEELCASAAQMANNLNARAIFVYTRRGYMANFLSRCRPDCPIFAFTGAFMLCTHFGAVLHTQLTLRSYPSLRLLMRPIAANGQTTRHRKVRAGHGG